SYKDFGATLGLLVLNQRPKLGLEPCARIRDDREIEVSDPLIHPRFGELVFDRLKSRQRRHASLEGTRSGLPVRPPPRPDRHQIALGGQHHAIDRGLDQWARHLPGYDLESTVTGMAVSNRRSASRGVAAVRLRARPRPSACTSSASWIW